MSRNYTLPTIKQLFAEAVMCAYPDCAEPLIFHERGVGTVVADIAHIRSESDKGPRYDENFQGDIDGVENLLLLCGKHHRPVDRHEVAYSVDELLAWKQAQSKAARAGGTAISDEQARAFVQLSAEEARALAQVARLSERVLAIAERTVAAVKQVLATREAEVRAFVRSHPMWEVDDDGTRTLVTASQMSLPKADEDRYRAEVQRVVAESRHTIEAAVDALREEIAILRMCSSGGLEGHMDAVIEAANRVLDNVSDRDATAAVRATVAALWRAANGEP